MHYETKEGDFSNVIFSNFSVVSPFKLCVCVCAIKNTTRRIHTCTGVHGAAVADDEAVPLASPAELEERVLNLDHRLQEVLLEFQRFNNETKLC